MPTLELTTRSGGRHSVQTNEGEPMMQALRDSGIADVIAVCGGSCACATCHVYVDEYWLNKVVKPTQDEADLISDLSHRKPNSRLSCQIIMTEELHGIEVRVAPEE